MTRIYTRGGDQGDTSLFGGGRVPKSDARVAAYGAVEEVSCALGLAAAELARAGDVAETIGKVQHHLFRLGGRLADPEGKAKIRPIGEEEVGWLEAEIDRLDASLPPLEQFVLPGGAVAASHLHMARALCRRAEREVVELKNRGGPMGPHVIPYLNRLSDYLFVAARFTNASASHPDVPWDPDF